MVEDMSQCLIQGETIIAIVEKTRASIYRRSEKDSHLIRVPVVVHLREQWVTGVEFAYCLTRNSAADSRLRIVLSLTAELIIPRFQND